MSEITPEPNIIADPSDPRWTPPEGNRVDVAAPGTPAAENERG